MEKKTRVFSYGEKDVVFDFKMFNELFYSFAKTRKKKIGEAEEFLAEKLCVTKEAVHNWRFSSNGPGDLETIQKLAEAFGLKEESDKLLKIIEKKENKRKEMMEQFTEKQMESFKRIYDSMIEFLYLFKNSGFFVEQYNEIIEQLVEENGGEDAIGFTRMQELYTLAKEKTQRWAEHAYEKVKVCYEQERFYLHHLSLYEKELEWALLDLRGMFLEGKEEDGVWIEEMIFPDTDEKYFKLFDKFYENYKYLDKIFNLGFYRDVKVAEEEKG